MEGDAYHHARVRAPTHESPAWPPSSPGSQALPPSHHVHRPGREGVQLVVGQMQDPQVRMPHQDRDALICEAVVRQVQQLQQAQALLAHAGRGQGLQAVGRHVQVPETNGSRVRHIRAYPNPSGDNSHSDPTHKDGATASWRAAPAASRLKGSATDLPVTKAWCSAGRGASSCGGGNSWVLLSPGGDSNGQAGQHCTAEPCLGSEAREGHSSHLHRQLPHFHCNHPLWHRAPQGDNAVAPDSLSPPLGPGLEDRTLPWARLGGDQQQLQATPAWAGESDRVTFHARVWEPAGSLRPQPGARQNSWIIVV